jgi:DNA polymerase III subunit delta
VSLRDDVQAGRIEPVYVLYGPESGPVREIVDALRRAVLTEGMAAFNHERLDGSKLEGVGAVLEACAQLPMMAPRRLVELSDPDAIGKGRGDKADLDALVAYIADPNPTTVLVITGTGLDGRSRLVTAAKKTGATEKFEPMRRDADAVQWVQEAAGRHGARIDRRTAAHLVELVGTSPSALDAALLRAATYAGAGRPVTVADVDAVVEHTREAVVFELTDAVGLGDAATALRVLARIFHDSSTTEVGQSTQMLSMLIRQVRLVYTAKVAPGGAAATGLPPFVAKKLSQQAARWTEARLRRAVAGLSRLDRDLKGGSLAVARAPYVALQRFVLDACAALPTSAPRV